ncbi:hypothetical protein NKR23_g4225 [Pleurostoma richardsiae]|uniref:Uncharacterized protein n=1 Tax=Pleurostoma richardsiae TaxID=41990 RepID=A0AA38VFX2_9PEZI|nr:hypothetical protein NKR23_g4225 [Pleurostoma richardsiae]
MEMKRERSSKKRRLASDDFDDADDTHALTIPLPLGTVLTYPGGACHNITNTNTFIRCFTTGGPVAIVLPGNVPMVLDGWGPINLPAGDTVLLAPTTLCLGAGLGLRIPGFGTISAGSVMEIPRGMIITVTAIANAGITFRSGSVQQQKGLCIPHTWTLPCEIRLPVDSGLAIPDGGSVIVGRGSLMVGRENIRLTGLVTFPTRTAGPVGSGFHKDKVAPIGTVLAHLPTLNTGDIIRAGTSIPAGTVLPGRTVIPAGSRIPTDTHFEGGVTLPKGTTYAEGVTLFEGSSPTPPPRETAGPAA